ncbi:MAG TPA: IPT/TIG domain-containing protein [Kofleriaceae bacterium]
MKRALLALALAGCGDDGGPRLDAVAPAMTPAGATVTLTGRRLCGGSGDCAAAGGEVVIGLADPVRATVTGYSDTSAEIVIPPAAPAGSTALYVTVNDQASNAIDFQVLPDP